jgi:hypothetical protein
MLKYVICTVLAGLFMAAAAGAGSEPDFKDGQWEITVKTEMVGMPMQMPPLTYTQCMTKSDPVPQSSQPDQQCRVVDMKTQGNTVSWAIKCDDSGSPITGEGKITYEKDRMNGSMKMTAEGMEMVSHFKGRYIGACP